MLSLGLLILSLALAVAMLGTGGTGSARPHGTWLPAGGMAAHTQQVKLATAAFVDRLAHEVRRWRVLAAHRLGMPLHNADRLPASPDTSMDIAEALPCNDSMALVRALPEQAGAEPFEELGSPLAVTSPNMHGAAVLGGMLWRIPHGDTWLAGLQRAASVVPPAARQKAALAVRHLERSAAVTRASVTSAWHAAEPYGARVAQAVQGARGFSPWTGAGSSGVPEDGAGIFLACVGAGLGGIVALAAIASASRKPARTRSLSRSQQVWRSRLFR